MTINIVLFYWLIICSILIGIVIGLCVGVIGDAIDNRYKEILEKRLREELTKGKIQ